ncbi:MAG: response regulator [Geminicoccaceae bacterium]
MAGLRILLVEDNVLIRMSTAAMLQDLGHSVREAGDADEALALLEAGPDDVLMTDIGLPGMSGTELAAAALSRWPALRVVFVSGQEPAGGPSRPDGARVLAKPYDREGLRRVLSAATS